MANFNVGEVIYRKEFAGHEAYLILKVWQIPYKKYMEYRIQVMPLVEVPLDYFRPSLNRSNEIYISSKDKNFWGKLDGQ